MATFIFTEIISYLMGDKKTMPEIYAPQTTTLYDILESVAGHVNLNIRPSERNFGDNPEATTKEAKGHNYGLQHVAHSKFELLTYFDKIVTAAFCDAQGEIAVRYTVKTPYVIGHVANLRKSAEMLSLRLASGLEKALRRHRTSQKLIVDEHVFPNDDIEKFILEHILR